MLRHRKLLTLAGLFSLWLGSAAAHHAIAQEGSTEAQIRTGARVASPPSGQNIRVQFRRAYVEPRNHDINRRYRGRVTSHPIERYLRTAERRLEHCIDSAPHPALALAPELNGNTVIRARLVIQGREITSVNMSDHPISPLLEQCLRAGFQATRGHLPRSGRIISVFYLRPRPSSS